MARRRRKGGRARENPDPEAALAIPMRPKTNGPSEIGPGQTESRGNGQGEGAQTGHGTKGDTDKIGAAAM